MILTPRILVYVIILRFVVLISAAPIAKHPLVELFFRRTVLRMPEMLILHAVGEILLWCEMPGIVVRILVAVVVSELGHQLCRCIADVHWYRLVAAGPYFAYGTVDSEICRIRFR